MGGFMNFRFYFYKGKNIRYSGKIPVFYNLVVKKENQQVITSPIITYDSKYSNVRAFVFSVRLRWGGLGMDSGLEKDDPTGRRRRSPLSLR